MKDGSLDRTDNTLIYKDNIIKSKQSKAKHIDISKLTINHQFTDIHSGNVWCVAFS
jgi:hypothetical protein